MKRTTLLSAMLALMLTTLGMQSVLAQSTLRRTQNDLEVDIWTDKDDGSNYFEGDDIYIYFRASEDAYVVVYDLDTRGNINLIFPEDPSDNNYVEAGEVYMVPNPDADYTYTLEGPPGDEHLQVIASRDYFPVPDWRGPVNVYDKDRLGVDFDGDDQEFIGKVNFKFFPQNSAYDQVSFYVAPESYYEPEQSNCYGDCGQVYVDYPNGCEVYVDGVFYGYAPLYMPHAYLGRHRVTVYWGTSIVYNDWIVVSTWDPFFVYPRPIWVYDYCWNHYYRDYHWGYYDYYGNDWGRDRGRYPSQTKYKNGDNFYSYHKPEPKRGYKVVPNSHAGYAKSNAYTSSKTSRITKFKTEYGYNKTTKVYTKSTAFGGKTGYKSGVTAKKGVQGTVNGKTAVQGNTAKKTYNTKNRGTYQKGGTSSGAGKGTVKGGSSSSGKKGGSVSGGSKSSGGSTKAGGSKGSSKGSSKSGGSKKSGGKATTGEKKSENSNDSGSKSSGGTVKKSSPHKGGGGGSKSTGGSKSGGSKSSGSKSKGKGKS